MMRRLEAGSALLYAILIMIIVAALAAGFTQMVMSSVERAKTRRDKVSQDAVVETAQTRIQYALQNNLISEIDGYNLTASDFKALANDGKSVPITNLPSKFKNSGGIWKYNSAGTHLSKTGNLNIIAMREALSDAAAACKSVKMAKVTCMSSIRGYWQPFRVDYPDISGKHAPNTVMTVRTWLGISDTKAVSEPRYIRFEWRPGRFADYQMISDGFITFGPGATINGPVHSNSYSIDETTSGTYAQTKDKVDASQAHCFGQAAITVTRGSVIKSPSCQNWTKTGQSINFTRAVEAIDNIRVYAKHKVPGSYQFKDTGHNGYTLVLKGSYASLNGPGISKNIPFTNNYIGIVVPGDVWVRGTVNSEKRVTIAAQHEDGGTADIHINGNITKGNQKSSAIGLMASGNVVLEVSPCITNIQAAMIAATGSLTIPPEMAVAERIAHPKHCAGKIRIMGSIAGHGPPIMLNQWKATGESAGYLSRTYEWDKQLRRNPPPFFPLTGTWQAVSVKEANVDCLFNAAKASNPDCR